MQGPHLSPLLMSSTGPMRLSSVAALLFTLDTTSLNVRALLVMEKLIRELQNGEEMEDKVNNTKCLVTKH